MISWLAALGAVVLAAAPTLASPAQGALGDVRIEVLSVTPRPTTGGAALRARRASGAHPGSGVDPLQRLDRRRAIQNIRLVWENSIARCYFRVPAGARGKRLTIGLAATLGGSLTRTTLAFRVS